MTFDGAVIREQGVTFGIMVVKPQVLADAERRDVLVSQASAVFGGIPTGGIVKTCGSDFPLTTRRLPDPAASVAR